MKSFAYTAGMLVRTGVLACALTVAARAADTTVPVRPMPNLRAMQVDSTTLQQAILLLGQPSRMGTDRSRGAVRQVVVWRGITPASNQHSAARELGHTAARSTVSSSIRHGLGKLLGSMSSSNTAQSIANDAARDTAYAAGNRAESSADQAISHAGSGQHPWTCTLYFSQAGMYHSGRCAED